MEAGANEHFTKPADLSRLSRQQPLLEPPGNPVNMTALSKIISAVCFRQAMVMRER
jgi:hypothetical protein